MRIDTISLVFSCFVSGCLGIAVLIRNFKNPVYRAFSLFCSVILARDFLCLMKGFDGSVFYQSRLFLLVSLFLGPVSLKFLKDLDPSSELTKRNQLQWVYFWILSLLSVLVFFPQYELWYGYLTAFIEASYLIPAYLWTRTLAQCSEQQEFPRDRIRHQYALWGLVFVVALHLTDTLYFAELSRILPLGTLARAFYLIFLFQLFIKKELLTAPEILSRASLFAVISLVLSSVYWLLVSWVGSRPGLFLFNTVIASFAILVLFEPLKSAVGLLMQKIFLKKNIELEEELKALADDLRGVANPRVLAERLASSFKRILGIEKATLYLIERDGVSYVKPDAKTSEMPQEISSASALVEYMTLRRGKPFVSDSIRSDLESFHSNQGRKFFEDCLDALRQLEGDLIVPFFYDGKVQGFVVAPLGDKMVVGSELLRMFVPVSRQIALLLKSAQTLTVLRERDQLATLGEMAAGLAHEIKNPLGAIKGAAELLAEEEDPATTSEYLGIIQDEAQRLSNVLTQFLEFAKPRKHDPESNCDPLKVIEHTAALVLRDSLVRFSVHAVQTGLLVDVDPELLKQVLVNLFLNATQAMEGEDSAEIQVKVSQIKARNRWSWGIPFFKTIEGWEKTKEQSNVPMVEIEVQDNGPGISPSERNKIFMPFYTTKSRGTGLGLAICKRLVESVGGSIQVKSRIPRGSRFILHLPEFSKEMRKQAVLKVSEVFG